MEFSNNSFAIPYNYATAPEGNVWANYSSGAGPPSQPPQVVIVQAPKLRRSFDGYASRAALTLGVVQVCLGILSICLGIANPLTCGLYGMIGFGIWCGVIVSTTYGTSCTVTFETFIISRINFEFFLHPIFHFSQHPC